MQMHARFLAAALATLPLSGCLADGTLSPDGSTFEATIQGSVQDTYRGTGQFHRVPGDPDRGRPGLFVIFSRDPLGGQTIDLFREGTGTPRAGSYPLAGSAAGSHRFGAVYTRRQAAGAVEGFTATSGELRIVTASERRIEGTFRFQGTRNCAGTASSTAWSLRCTYPLDPDEPSVEVAGSFVAVPQGTIPPIPPLPF